ncbi:MAG: M23 family metallopeptidase [Nitrospirae bacterium]|nr:MAG: M23 family metallopeptidase [Nitrospirota bacterium]
MSKTSLFIAGTIALVLIYLGIVASARWGDTDPPVITLMKPFDRVGPATPLVLHIEDKGTGLRHVTVRIEHNRETYTLADETLPSHGFFSLEGGTRHSYDFEVTPYGDQALPHKHGEAKLIVVARDYSWHNLFEGNSHRLTQEFTPKFVPPRLELLAPPTTLTQGGSGVVRYRVSSDAVRHGVRIGEAFFPGYSTPDNEAWFALIAFPYNADPRTPLRLIAEDGLGNTATMTIDFQVTPKTWRTRQIRITDRFIERTVLPLLAQTPELAAEEANDLLSKFLLVNRTLRQRNNQFIADLAQRSRPEFLWHGPFKQLPGSQVEAAFADHRQYLYRGKVVDTQDHLGFDLAVTKHHPVQAANDGIVVFAGYLGIYGNAIVIDHGYGLQSLYAHLSSYHVEEGDQVVKGQEIGRSGTTGLAAGDHVHFSLILHGHHINPTEWWDPFWVKTRIMDPLGLMPSPSTHEKVPPPEAPALAPPPPARAPHPLD